MSLNKQEFFLYRCDKQMMIKLTPYEKFYFKYLADVEQTELLKDSWLYLLDGAIVIGQEGSLRECKPGHVFNIGSSQFFVIDTAEQISVLSSKLSDTSRARKDLKEILFFLQVSIVFFTKLLKGYLCIPMCLLMLFFNLSINSTAIAPEPHSKVTLKTILYKTFMSHLGGAGQSQERISPDSREDSGKEIGHGKQK